MKKVSNRNYFGLGSYLATLAAIVLLSVPNYAQEADAANGKKLFKTNCAACHKLDKKLVGPALGDVTERRDQEWLYAWIKDNAALRASGDADAIAIYEEYGGSPMQAFPMLSDQDIADILEYTANPPAPAQPVVAEAAGTAVDQEAENQYMTAILAGLLFLLTLLIILLFKVKNTLRKIQGQPEITVKEEVGTLPMLLVRNQFAMGLITIALIIGGLFVAWGYMLDIGVDQGYQPIQPIAFSHKIHSGDNQVDCQYCHSSAKHSKHSGIPSANVCMNCHKYIQEGTTTGTEEIAKIYDAIGFDVETGQYIADYEQKPIKWVRIHNLPDFAYFNHSQHVTVGGLECQECHGPVETMEEVYQYSDLTMGWCINCHRETNVNVKDNAYYENIHKDLAKKYGKDKVTVDMIGGLECGKCHY